MDVPFLRERFTSLIKTFSFLRGRMVVLYRFHLVLKCDGKGRRKNGGGDFLSNTVAIFPSPPKKNPNKITAVESGLSKRLM